MDLRRVLGMDGWRRGWVGIVLVNGEFESAIVHTTAVGAISAAGTVEVVGIDIPIGLPAAGTRLADSAARGLLGPRRATLFPVPPREVIEAADYAEANATSRARHGTGISRQSYALREKILEVDPLARRDRRLHEVHPELSFARMDGAPLPTKRSWEGAARRRRLLAAHGIELPDDLGDAGAVPVDDVLDAAAAAWTADRIAAGTAEAVPAEHVFDGPLRMAIWM